VSVRTIAKLFLSGESAAEIAAEYPRIHPAVIYDAISYFLDHRGEIEADITDEENRTEDVHGPGVVGEQPVLAPGESFQYTSGCPLTTPTGTMHGTYQMVTSEGDSFDAEIAPFVLSEPYVVN
jgi:hypothetical protein